MLSSQQLSWWLFLLPSALVLGSVMLFPLGYAIYLSLFNYDLGSGAHDFIGLGNYAALLADERFWGSLDRTVMIVFCAVCLEFCVGLLIAYGLYRLTFGTRVLNLLLFLPSIVTPVVAALFLRWIFIGRWGLVSGVLIGLGIFPPDFLGNPAWARATVVLADAWQFTPFMILVLYAGLNTVDHSQIEAAQLDGAGPWTLLFRIMLPSIRAVDRVRAGDPADGCVPLLRHDLCADRRRAGHRNRDDHAVHLRPCVPPASGWQGVGARRVDAAVRRRVHRADDPRGLPARTGCLLMRHLRRLLMRRHLRTQLPLFLLLCGFTAVNLTPVIWGVLTSIKQPVDAFAVPPRLFFTPTWEFHEQIWVDKGFWRFLINSAVISAGTVVTSVSVGTMAAYGLSRLSSARLTRAAVRAAVDAHVPAHPAGDSVLRAGADARPDQHLSRR